MVMSDFMSALHFEQCIAIVPDSCDPEDEHPQPEANPSATMHAIAVLIAQLLD
jgi:hypothetical protein